MAGTQSRLHDAAWSACGPNSVSHAFKSWLGKAGLPTTTRFHDLRHSCATLLLVQGVSPRVVMEILGHNQISTTMNIYAHVLSDSKRDAADQLEALFAEQDRAATPQEGSSSDGGGIEGTVL